LVYDENELPISINYKVTENIDKIINNPEINAIFICTPNYLNKPLTVQALEAGKHVFCEKPPAFNSREVEEIISVEKKSGKILMYGFNHRHHESIRYMRKLIDSKEFGKVLWMRGRYGKSVDKFFFDTWRARKKLAGGGILLDQGIHMLDLFIMLGGDFDSVQADVSSCYWNLDIEDNVFAIYKNSKTGVVASLHSTMTQWRHLFSLEVFLEKGYMVLNGLKTSSGTYGDEILSIAKNRTIAPAAVWEDEERITFETDNSWTSEINHFLNAIENDTPVPVGSSADALAVMKLIDQTYKNGG
jgi:predicted dehydrogenase